MFDFIGSQVDGLYKLLWLVITLYLLLSGEISYLLRLISRPLKVDFSDKNIKKIDDDLLDLQLLRLYHGINVVNKKDAILICKAIGQNVLSEKDFRFLSFAPPIGNFKHGKVEVALCITMAILLFIELVFVCKLMHPYKYDYAPYSTENERVLISEIYVYDPINNEHLNTKQCRALTQSESTGILVSACGYLLTNDPIEKLELTTAIKNNNSSLTAAKVLIAILIFILAFLIFVYFFYYQTNNKFIIYKESENL